MKEGLTNFSVGKNSHSSIYRFELINKGAGAPQIDYCGRSPKRHIEAALNGIREN